MTTEGLIPLCPFCPFLIQARTKWLLFCRRYFRNVFYRHQHYEFRFKFYLYSRYVAGGSNWNRVSFGTVYALVIKQWWFISPTDTGIARLTSVKWSLLTVSHYSDVITGTMASQITSLTIVYSTVQSGTHQRKRQSSASLAFVRGIHRSPHKRPVMRKMFPFDDVIIKCGKLNVRWFDAMSLV